MVAGFAEKSQYVCRMLGGLALIIILHQACRLDMKWAQYSMQAIFNYQYDEDIITGL